jgi:lysine-N-methylase
MADRIDPQLPAEKVGGKRLRGADVAAARRALAAGPGFPMSRLPTILPPVRRLPPQRLPGRPIPAPEREYSRPAYGERFRCIGSACEDTCCKDWGVPIDRGTYERYRSSEVMKPHLGTLIVLNTEAPTASDYARIPIMAQSACPFLDSERLCGIQKQLGAEMLSATCATYPRAVDRRGTQVENSLNLSCPEATRLTLLDPNLLGDSRAGFEVWRSTAGERYSAVIRDAVRLPLKYQPHLAIREFALLLLADRSYPLWQRLYLLDILARRLEAQRGPGSASQWAAANPVQVAKLLADSARVVVMEKLRPAMDEIEAQPDQQLQLLVELMKLRVSQPPVAARFVECLQDFQAGLGTSGVSMAKSEAEVLGAYVNGYRRYYRPLMERHPHLLENYLANYIFKNGYPFGRPRNRPLPPGQMVNAESEHLSMCVHAGLAQMLLIGMASHYGEAFGVEHVVKLVQSLAKTIEHSQPFLDQIPGFLHERNLNNPRGIAVLLKPAD